MATQANANKSSNKQRIERLVKQARKQADSKTPKLFFDFLRHYFRNATVDDLDQFEDQQLVQMAKRHYAMARSRKRGDNRVEVFQPEQSRDGWQQPRCVVMTATDDMPFLVDSLMLALREIGPSLQWMVHPVLRVSRDKRGQLRELHRLQDAQTGATESMVHMQSGPLPAKQRQQLQDNLQALMRDLSTVVADWPEMQTVTRQVIEELARAPAGCDMQQVGEAQAYMQWLSDHRFTFLGYCRRSLVAGKSGSSYVTDAGTGMGLLRDDLPKRDPEGYVASSLELDKYAQSTRVLVISRGNSRSWIHHGEYMDVISIKRFAPDGSVCGLHRFIGLFAGEAYASSPRLIPVVRQKLAEVTERADLRPQSHTAKNLNEILDSLPRDELFQASEDELYEMAMGILGLRDRQHLKLFIRQDRYRRFCACMIYMPRERFSHDVRERVASVLSRELGGEVAEINTEFLRHGMARLYCIVPTPESAAIDQLRIPALEHKLIEATRSWQEHIVSVAYSSMDEAEATEAIMRFRDHLPASYTATVAPEQAVADLQTLMALEDQGLSLRLTPAAEGMQLRVYTRGFSITLSDLLPRLEHYGLQVRSQQPYESQTEAGFYELQVLELDAVDIPAREMAEACQRFEAAFLQSWYGQTESDGFNQLVLRAGLDWRQVVLLRTVCKYLLQTGLPFGQRYIEDLLASHADITRDLFRLFESRFDPAFTTRAKDVAAARKRSETGLAKSLREKLDAVSSLDADRAMRAFLGVILAAERTNYYQHNSDGQAKSWVSLKIASARVHELPEPRPLYETFVYSPKVEGIHLRGGMVARGGLRWSDRRADFRTEVLGLMKAQMVKNTVIVPSGAKGGFVVKGGPPPADREAWLNNGIECYKTFLRGLLDITDNIVDDQIVPPQNVVRHDGDDPYLVVAADKGTATFSDIANGVSEDYGHWLGDAFASGGSAGYDHKKMGITARGAWELVKRHFREIGTDIQNEDFTVVGIGDMAGDVFGNGMLLSKHIRLVAAFNHMHIFLDPDPNPATSFAERQRLFKLPRSSWADYDNRKISKGGGLFERSAKSIKLTKAVQDSLGIEADSLSPNELISAILKAPVDLVWNGGIGTYVKGSNQSHGEVGDRANDNLR
ncbi:MAG: NAD-glutamate dehydrogenase domain-containing protein, partial [Nevskiales bacterium]